MTFVLRYRLFSSIGNLGNTSHQPRKPLSHSIFGLLVDSDARQYVHGINGWIYWQGLRRRLQSYVSMAMWILIMTIDKLSFISDTWPTDGTWFYKISHLGRKLPFLCLPKVERRWPTYMFKWQTHSNEVVNSGQISSGDTINIYYVIFALSL